MHMFSSRAWSSQYMSNWVPCTTACLISPICAQMQSYQYMHQCSIMNGCNPSRICSVKYFSIAPFLQTDDNIHNIYCWPASQPYMPARHASTSVASAHTHYHNLLGLQPVQMHDVLGLHSAIWHQQQHGGFCAIEQMVWSNHGLLYLPM